MGMKNRLGEVLEVKGVTQIQLASFCKVTRGTISNIVNHKYEPSLQLAYLIAEYLNLQVTDIFYYDKD